MAAGRCTEVAEAGTEGGFQGFGGVAVSDVEKAIIKEISTALAGGTDLIM